MTRYWLLKSEPEVYSIDQLAKDKKTNWDHVRNFQARNVLRSCKKGEFALIYHSNDDRAVVGVACVVKEAYPDPDPDHPGDWSQIDVRFVTRLATPVTLATIKGTPTLQNLPLIKQSRLSCMEVGAKEFEILLKLGGSWAGFQKHR
ncbi:EVE domain-containing protein [bacterium]|jgi:predicted RNA-binding protein with PUA-like domain|nr:EVE domain-containing protein [bacterium]